MLTETGIQNMWKTHVGARYNKIARARPYAVTPESKRFLVWLWLSCEKLEPSEPDKLFQWSLEKLADEAGVNVLQPAPPAELKAPDAWRDPWNNPLPNPFATDDLQGQTLLTQRDPVLAEWLKKFAASPYAAATEWSDKQAALLKQKALTYYADTHAVNPFANGANETDKAAFVRNADKATLERSKWEATPVTFPTAGKNFSLTAQSRISTVPRLSALWNAMAEEERQYVASEKVALQKQWSETEQRLKALESSDAAPAPPRMASRARVGAE